MTKKQVLRGKMEDFGFTMTDVEYKRTTFAQMETKFIELEKANRVAKMADRIKHIADIKLGSSPKQVLKVAGHEFTLYGKGFTSKDMLALTNEPDMYDKKREQYVVRESSLDSLKLIDNKLTLSDDCVRQFPISESRVLRDSFEQQSIEKVFNNIVRKFADNIIILDCDVENDIYMVHNLVENGFEYEGRTWRVLLRSASQARTYKMVFTSLDPEKTRMRLTYHANFADSKGMINPAKKDAYTGNGMASSKLAGTDYDYAVIPDFKINTTQTVVVWSGDVLEEPVEQEIEITLTPTDGQGAIRPIAAARASYKIGLISKESYIFFMEHFVSLAHMKTIKFKTTQRTRKETKLLAIFDMIPKAFQIRPAGFKGLVVMFDHDEYGFDCDLVLTESMEKYMPLDEAQPFELEVLAYSKKPSKYTYSNYQQLQALNMNKESIIELADKALARVRGNDSIFTNATRAKEFLGLIGNVYDGEEFEVRLASELMIALDASELVLSDSRIQKKLAQLSDKYVKDISVGRMPIEGQYAYIVTDPAVMFDSSKPYLLKDEYYYNGEEKEYVLTRSPLIHRSEVVSVKTVSNDNVYWYLEHVLVLNAFSAVLPRMGGADTDGDKALMSADPILVKSSYPQLPMLYDAGKSGEKIQDSPEAMNAFWANNMAPKAGSNFAQIGPVTNAATCFNDISLNNGDVTMHESQVMKLRFLQGWAIDAPKTNHYVEHPKALKTDYIPTWIKAIKDSKGRDISKKAIPYESSSPIGQLHKYVMEFYNNEFLNIPKAPIQNVALLFSKSVDPQVVSEIKDKIKSYELNYRRQFAKLQENFNNNIIDEDTRKKLTVSIIENYTMLMASLPGDNMTKAAIAYGISYFENNSESTSFPWTTCFEGLIELLIQNTQNKRMVKLPSKYLKDKLVKTVYAINDIMYFNTGDSDGFKVKSGLIPDGQYTVKSINDTNYIDVDCEKDYTKVYAKINKLHIDPTVKADEVAISGFKYNNVNVKDFIKAFEENKYADLIMVDGYVAVIVDGKKYGVVSKTKQLDIDFVNSRVEITHHEDPWMIDSKTKVNRLRQSLNCTIKHVAHLDIRMDLEDEISISQYEDMLDSDYDFIMSDMPSDIELIDSGEVLILEELTIKPILDSKIMSSVKTDTWYWSEESIEAPMNVVSHELTLLNVVPNGEVTAIAELKATNPKGQTYTFSVVYSTASKSLELIGPVTPNKSFIAWALRLASYKAAERRLSV